MIGRWLIPADAPPGQDPDRVVVLGYQFWQRYYAGDPARGRADDPAGAQGLSDRRRDAAAVPLARSGYLRAAQGQVEPNIYYGATLKIRPGVSTAEANAELQPILQQFAAETPARYPDQFRVNLRSIIELYARPMGPRLYLLLGAVASLLLIGCANVSILLLVRGAHRQQEFAVRAALGAARVRIVRQLLTEAMVIAVAGAVLGVLIAWRGLALIVAWIPTNSFAAESVIEMNLPVLLFSTALAIATALVFGVWPALQLSRPDLGRVAQASTRRVMGSAHGRRIHRVMVGGAGRADAADAYRRRRGREGLPEAGERRSRLRPAEHDVPADPGPRWHLRDVEGAVRVLRAAPRGGRGDAAGRVRRDFDQRDAARQRRRHHARDSRQRRARRSPWPARTSSAPSTFRCCRFRWRRAACGSATKSTRGATLAVINQTMARQYWPNGDAVGRQFRFASMKDEPPYSPAAAGGDGWLQIIGVVADARNDGLRNPIKPAFYVPYTLKMRMFTQILVRTRVPPLSILRDMRAELVRVDREQQVMRVRDLNGWITDMPEYAQQRLMARLFAIFSLLALALSAVGLYSVVSYGVATRTNEFGIRMALGAKARDVVRIVMSGNVVERRRRTGRRPGAVPRLRQARVAVGDREPRDPAILGGVTLCCWPLRRSPAWPRRGARRRSTLMEALRHQ